MRASGVRRGYVMWDGVAARPLASHSVLEPLRAFCAADEVDYDAHEGVFLEAYEDAVFGVFLHRTRRGQGCGGIRLRAYDSLEAYWRDGVRLAVGMGRKSALAGLWAGGGKGVIALGADTGLAQDPERRRAMLRAYGRFITSLRGAYVAAEDAGITVDDMDVVFETTRYLTCISPTLGGSGNPSVPTAMGVVAGMEGACAALGLGAGSGAGAGSLEGRTVAVQGCGNVGGPMIEMLLRKGVARVVASELCEERAAAVRAACLAAGFGEDRLEIRTPAAMGGMDRLEDVLFEDVDIASPCAFGGVINASSAPRIRARAVCGAANNQLLDPSSDYGLTARGVLYCPDFVVNRMGIVNCADEAFGRVGSPEEAGDPLVARHFCREDADSIFNVVVRVAAAAREQGRTTARVAEELADEQATLEHPIFGHRSLAIMQSLVKDGWACPDDGASAKATATAPSEA